MKNATKQNEAKQIKEDVLKNSSKNQQQKSKKQTPARGYTLIDFNNAYNADWETFKAFIIKHEITPGQANDLL